MLPALAELRYVKTSDLAGGYFSYAKHFVYLFQFVSPLWDYGYAGEGPVDQMPYQLGAVPVVLALLALVVVLQVRGNGFSRSDSAWRDCRDGEVRSNGFSRSSLVQHGAQFHRLLPAAHRRTRSSSCWAPRSRCGTC